MSTNLSDIRQALLTKKKQLQQLQDELESLQRAELMALPKRVGVDTVDDLIKLLLPLASPALRSAVPEDAHPARRPRAIVTPEMRKKAAELLASGKLTALEVAQRVGVSVSFVNKLKAVEGLTLGTDRARK